MQEFRVGSEVRLNVEENPRLHGASGVIKEIVKNEGIKIYKISTLSAATGEFRALEEELVMYNKEMNGSGYTGNVCNQCGSTRMRRIGTCETCQECGQSTGC